MNVTSEYRTTRLDGRKKMKIEGKTIQIDLSGGQGHRWTDVEGTEDDVALSNDLQEISCEIIDGKVDQHDNYVTQSGTHYRWS
jgi:hypothetical protein